MNDFFIKKKKRERIRSSRTQKKNFKKEKEKAKQLKKERVLYEHKRK